MSKFCLIFFTFFAVVLFSQEQDEFDHLMGMHTKHGENLSQPQEKALLASLKALYKERKDLQLLEYATPKIPKTVHFIWLGPRHFPASSVENVRTWMAQNPDWTFKFWTDRPRPAPCKGMEEIVITSYPFPYLGKYYALSENWGEKSDILRFEILYQEGGVYVDHDANCLRPFSGMHGAYDFYCGLEAPHPEVAGLNITAGNGVIGSRSQHPMVKKVIDLIASRWESVGAKYPGKDTYSATQVVMERTYLPLTLAIQTDLNQEGNTDIVLPAAYFFAKPGIFPLYSKHFFANSWADENSKAEKFESLVRQKLSLFDRSLHHFSLFAKAIFVFNVCLIGMGFIFLKKRRV